MNIQDDNLDQGGSKAGSDHGSHAQEQAEPAVAPAGQGPMHPLAGDRSQEKDDRGSVSRDGKNNRGNFLGQISPAEWLVVLFTAITAFAALYQGFVSKGQWQLSREQLREARQSALSSGQETRAALQVAQRSADAAERQSVALERALGISARVAGASETQAQISKSAVQASEQLVEANRAALQDQRQGQINITAVGPIKNYDILLPVPTAVTFMFKNVGTSTMYNVEISANIGLVPSSSISKVFEQFPKGDTETIPPNGEEPATIKLPYPISAAMFQQLEGGDARIVAVARAKFRNRGERGFQYRYACYQYFGAPRDPVTLACPTPKQGPG